VSSDGDRTPHAEGRPDRSSPDSRDARLHRGRSKAAEGFEHRNVV